MLTPSRDTRAKIPLVDSTLADIRKANAAGGNYAGQFVVYDLPDRDCAAAASNGEYAIADGGVAKYKEYIDAIRTMILKYSDIRILLVIGNYLVSHSSITMFPDFSIQSPIPWQTWSPTSTLQSAPVRRPPTSSAPTTLSLSSTCPMSPCTLMAATRAG